MKKNSVTTVLHSIIAILTRLRTLGYTLDQKKRLTNITAGIKAI